MGADILVVDADPRERATLAEGLDRRGFSVAQAGNAAEAVSRLAGRAPRLIIADADGDAGLVGKLRRSAQNVPVILLARDESMAMAMSQGADDVLQKPIHISDLAVLARVATAPDPRAFSGSLAELRLPHLLRALTSSGRSGRIAVGAGDGRIVFREGRIVDAFYRRLRGEPALLRMLTLTAGRFDVEFVPVHRRGSLEFGLRDVLTRGFPYVRRWEQIVASTYPLTAKLQIDFRALPQALPELPDEVNRVMRLFDGKKTLEQVIDDSSFDDLTALEVVGKLDALGLLHRVDPHDKAPGPFYAQGEASVPAGEALLKEIFGKDRPAEGPLPGEALDWFADYVKGQGSWEEILPGADTGGWVEMPVGKAVGAALLAEAIDEALGEAAPGRGPTWFEPPPRAPAPIELREPAPIPLISELHLPEPAEEPEAPAHPIALVVEAPPLEATPRVGVELPPGLGIDLPTSADGELQLEWHPVREGRFDATPVPVPSDPGELVILSPQEAPAAPEVIELLPVQNEGVDPSSIEPIPLDPHGEGMVSVEEAPPPPRRAPWLVAAVLAVAAGAALANFARSPPPAPPEPVAALPEPPAPEPEAAPLTALENEPQVLRVERARALVLTAEAQKLYENGELDGAEARAEDAITLDPTSVPAALLLGIVAVDSGQASRAVEVLEHARTLEPANGRAAVLLGFAYQTMGQRERALQEYEDYLKIAPDGEQADDVRRVLSRLTK